MKVDAVLRARMHSTRLPGKTLLPAVGKTMLEHALERIGRATTIDRIVVATSERSEDDPIAALCAQIGSPCFRGSADDVLDRVYRCVAEYSMAHVAHFGADNPLIDPAVCDLVIGVYLEQPGLYDYVTNNLLPTFPDGLEVEVTSSAALETAWREAREPRHREHFLTYLWDHPGRFTWHNVTLDPPITGERWTVDLPEDYELVRILFEALYPLAPAFTMHDVIAYLDAHPELRELNARHHRHYEWLAP